MHPHTQTALDLRALIASDLWIEPDPGTEPLLYHALLHAHRLLQSAADTFDRLAKVKHSHAFSAEERRAYGELKKAERERKKRPAGKTQQPAKASKKPHLYRSY